MRLASKLSEESTIKSEEIFNFGSSERIPSNKSPLPKYDCEITRVEDSDSDSGIMKDPQGYPNCPDPVKQKVDNDVNEIYAVESRKNEIYDRESILHELAKSQDPSVLQYVLNIERMRKDLEESLVNSDHGAGANQSSGKTAEKSPQSNFERFRDALQAVPDSILHLLMGLDRPGDCGRSSEQKPDWLDMEKLRRGQKFADEYIFSVSFANMLSLFPISSFADGIRALIFNQKSNTPYRAFKRMLSTGLRFRNWYTNDLWTKGSPGRKDVLMVRAMHAAVNRRMNGSKDEELLVASTRIPNAWCPTRKILLEDFSETCDAPAIGQCPYMTNRNNPLRVKGINQMDMAIVQWSFVGLMICFPESCGIHYATEEDLDDYCYFWRNIGYQLGIEDEFNICRGTLEDIRQRSSDIVEFWVKPNFREITPEWEHVMRCLISGTNVVVPVPCKMYETALLYLTEIIGLTMPRLYASLSYKDWIIYNVAKFTFKYVMKIPGITRAFNLFLNKSLDRAEKFTPEKLGALRVRLAEGFGSDAK